MAARHGRKKKGEPKVKLLPHEATLLEQGLLVDISHGGSNIWLKGEAHEGLLSLMMTVVYRPMGDFEVLHLVKHGTLPSTQPYQAIMEGEAGRRYAEKYLKGIKRVDTSPTTVVEFTAPRAFIEGLFRNQSKIEDGAMSTGLGNKAGKGLAAFNSRLLDGSITYRIVLVKRGHVDANIMAAARDAVSAGTFGTALKHERPAGASSTAASASASPSMSASTSTHSQLPAPQMRLKRGPVKKVAQENNPEPFLQAQPGSDDSCNPQAPRHERGLVGSVGSPSMDLPMMTPPMPPPMPTEMRRSLSDEGRKLLLAATARNSTLTLSLATGCDGDGEGEGEDPGASANPGASAVFTTGAKLRHWRATFQQKIDAGFFAPGSTAGPKKSNNRRHNPKRPPKASKGQQQAQQQAGAEVRDCIGIDFGNVICGGGTGHHGGEDTSMFSNNYLLTPVIPGAFEAIRRLVAAHGAHRIFIVSKAGEKMREKSRHWLEHRDFYRRTGFRSEHLIFCKDRNEKGPICTALKVGVFVDDRADVLQGMPEVAQRFLFPTDGAKSTGGAGGAGITPVPGGWDEILRRLGC